LKSALSRIGKHRLTRNITAMYLMTAVNYVVPFIVLLHLTRVLGPDLYGVVAFASGIMMLAMVLVDFGYGLSATNKISRHRNNRKYVAGLLGGILRVKLVLIAISAVVVIGYALLTEKYADYRLVLMFSILPVLAQGLVPNYFFQGIEQIRYLAGFEFVSRCTYMVLVFLFVRHDQSYWLVPVLNGAGHAATLVFSFVALYRLGYWVDLRNQRMMRYARQMNRGYFMSRVAVTAYMNAAPVLLGLFSMPAAVGVYQLARQLYGVMQTMAGALSQAVYPYMAKERNLVLYRKLALGVVAATLVGSVVGYLLAPTVILKIFGAQWSESIDVLNVFFAAIIVHVCAVFAGYPICAAVNRVDVANRSVVFGAILYFVMFLGVHAASLITPISLALMMMLAELYVFIHRYLGIRSALGMISVKENT